MNRIIIRYTKSPTIIINNNKMSTSVLEVLVDIKGYTCRPLIKAYGKEADIMYQLLQCIDWNKAQEKDFMHYSNEEIDTEVKEQDYKRFINLIYGLKNAKEFGYETW